MSWFFLSPNLCGSVFFGKFYDVLCVFLLEDLYHQDEAPPNDLNDSQVGAKIAKFI